MRKNMLFSDTEAIKYRDINKVFLLANDLEIDFDVFVRPSSREKAPPILLFGGGASPGEIRNTLKKKRHGRLCIRREDHDKFLDFVEDAIEKTIESDDVPLEKKSSLVYNCATDTIRAVFDDPRSGENIKRTKKVTNTIIKFALGNSLSIPSLLKLGSHDYYTFTHCVNVAVFSIGLWLMMGRGAEDVLEDFALGCILHDVGKTGIDHGILNKKGKLTDEEFEIIKKHPRYGYDLMKNSVPDISLDVMLHHHEKFDGSGYPHGLKEESISDYAKVAAIADVYDALTTNRPYADARDPFKATLLMKENMVGHFEQEKFVEFIYFLSGKTH